MLLFKTQEWYNRFNQLEEIYTSSSHIQQGLVCQSDISGPSSIVTYPASISDQGNITVSPDYTLNCKLIPKHHKK